VKDVRELMYFFLELHSEIEKELHKGLVFIEEMKDERELIY
jgi:hypothetical protein